jgi:nitrilase
MDARRHYSSPELLSLLIDRTPASSIHEHTAHPKAEAMRAATGEERAVELP